MAPKTVKTRVLIISDTHCASLKHPLPSADLLIHCGDLTYTGLPEQHHKALDMLEGIDAPVKVVIAGNHERTLDREFMSGHSEEYGPEPKIAEELFSKMRKLWTAEDGRAKKEGVTFLDEGTHMVNLPNGASLKVYASAYTPEFCDWAFPYQHYEDRFNQSNASLSDAKNIAAHPIPPFTSADRPLDILVTHGPPYGRLDETKNGDLAGCPHLLRALMRARPLLHCFGHIHEGRGAERVRWAEVAGDAAGAAATMKVWRVRGWEQGVKEVKAENQEWGFGDGQQNNVAVVSASQEGGKELDRGQETVSCL